MYIYFSQNKRNGDNPHIWSRLHFLLMEIKFDAYFSWGLVKVCRVSQGRCRLRIVPLLGSSPLQRLDIRQTSQLIFFGKIKERIVSTRSDIKICESTKLTVTVEKLCSWNKSLYIREYELWKKENKLAYGQFATDIIFTKNVKVLFNMCVQISWRERIMIV